MADLSPNVVVTVNGIAADGSVGTILVWGLITTDQTPNWVSIDDSETPGWSDINQSQTPGWNDIPNQ